MQRRVVLTLAVLGVVLGSAGLADAGLLITIEDQTISAGQAASVNVWIRTDDGSSVTLDSFGYKFLITQGGGVQTALQFDAPATDDLALGSVPTRTPGYPGDTYSGFQDYDPPRTVSSNPIFLGSLSITAAGNVNPPGAGDQFTISLAPSSGTDADFGDSFFSESDTDLSLIAFDSTSGTITVTGDPPLTQAVPEPATLAAALSGLVVLGSLRWRSRRYRLALRLS
jgi:hypothetical protein